jgi:hypothetical protein
VKFVKQNTRSNYCFVFCTIFKQLILSGMAALVLCSFLATGAQAQAANIYITPDGGGSGICTSSTHNPAWFNNSANWGSGGSSIGPGSIVHLCGTFSAGAGADSYLQFQGSGTSSSPITLLFESGTVLQAPYFSDVHGGIDGNGQSWIVIDGGNGGIIRNTANGTSLQYQEGSTLVKGFGNNSTIKNLSMLNVYVHTNGDAKGGGSYGLYARGSSNFTVGPNNTFTQCDVCFFFAYDGGEHDLIITGNSFSSANQDIEMGPANTGTKVMNNIRVDHNTATNWVNWDDPGDDYHHNFFHPFTNTPGSSIQGTLQIYDNTLSGDMGVHATSMLFLENNNGDSGGSMGAWWVFDNTFNKTNANVPTSSGMVAVMSANGFLLNNTFVDAGGTGSNAYVSFHLYGGATGWTVKNNIFQGGAYMIYAEASPASADKNVYYNSPSDTPWILGSTFIGALSQWKSSCGCDSGAVSTNPSLNPDLTLGSASSAASLGVNLASLGVKALDYDKQGTLRPTSGAWSAGANQLGSAAAQAPNPPTGLSATVN